MLILCVDLVYDVLLQTLKKMGMLISVTKHQLSGTLVNKLKREIFVLKKLTA
jgi:hypothetical protein